MITIARISSVVVGGVVYAFLSATFFEFRGGWITLAGAFIAFFLVRLFLLSSTGYKHAAMMVSLGRGVSVMCGITALLIQYQLKKNWLYFIGTGLVVMLVVRFAWAGLEGWSLRRSLKEEMRGTMHQPNPLAPAPSLGPSEFAPDVQPDDRIVRVEVPTLLKPAPEAHGVGGEPPITPTTQTIETPRSGSYRQGAIPVGSKVMMYDFTQAGGFAPGIVVGIKDDWLIVDQGDGEQHEVPLSPYTVQVIQLAPSPPPPRSATTIMRDDGIGGLWAVQKAKTERDAYTAATGVVIPDNAVDDAKAMLNDPCTEA